MGILNTTGQIVYSEIVEGTASSVSMLQGKMAREIVKDNWYLNYHGVETEAASLKGNSRKIFLLKTIQRTILRLLFDCRKEINEDSYRCYYNYANRFFNQLFNVLPTDLHNKKYVKLHKSYALPTIAKFMQIELCKPGDTVPADIFAAVSKIDWTICQATSGRNGSQLLMNELLEKLSEVAATTTR